MITNSVQFFKGKTYNNMDKECQIVVAAWKLKTPGNVGQVIRLAHNVGAKEALFIDNGKIRRTSEIKKTAGFSYEQMKWEFINEEDFWQRIPSGFKLVAVETSSGSENIYTLKLPPKTVLLIGSESKGIPEEVLNKCDLSVHIPMPGGCKSLNVSHAAAVASFEWYRQQFF